MEAIFWMPVGAVGVVCLILMRLAAQHGWAWVRAQVTQHAMDAESGFTQRVSAAVGDLDGRVKAAVDRELAEVKADLAALKTKVGA
jgi:hypothetical protein